MLTLPRRPFFFYFLDKFKAWRAGDSLPTKQAQPQPPSLLDQLPELESQPMTRDQDFHLRRQREGAFSHLQQQRMKKADAVLGTNTHFFQFDKARYQRIDSVHIMQRHIYARPTPLPPDPKQTMAEAMKLRFFRWKIAPEIRKARAVPKHPKVVIKSNEDQAAISLLAGQRAYFSISCSDLDKTQQALRQERSEESSRGQVWLGDAGVEGQDGVLASWEQMGNMLQANDIYPQIQKFLTRVNEGSCPYFLHSFRVSQDERFLALSFHLDFDCSYALLVKDLSRNQFVRKPIILTVGNSTSVALHFAHSKLYFVDLECLCRVSPDDLEAEKVQVFSAPQLTLHPQPAQDRVLIQFKQQQNVCTAMIQLDGSVKKLRTSLLPTYSALTEHGLYFTQLKTASFPFDSWLPQYGVSVKLKRFSSQLTTQESTITQKPTQQLELNQKIVLESEADWFITGLTSVKGYLCVLSRGQKGVRLNSLSLRTGEWSSFQLSLSQAFFQHNQGLNSQEARLIGHHLMSRVELSINLWSQQVKLPSSRFAVKASGIPVQPLLPSGSLTDLNGKWLESHTIQNTAFDFVYAKSLNKQQPHGLIVLADEQLDQDPTLYDNFLSLDFVAVRPHNRGSLMFPLRFKEGARQNRLTCYCDLLDVVTHLLDSKKFKSLSILGIGQLAGLDALTLGLKLGDLLASVVCIVRFQPERTYGPA